MSFERFTGKRPQSKHPTACLTAAGTIVFNRAAVDACLRDATHAELYFDAASRRVGVKFLKTPQTELAYTVTRYSRQNGDQRGTSAFISCQAFFGAHALPRKHLRRGLEWSARDELWTFKVAQIA